MKVRKFIEGLSPKIAPMVYMSNAGDLEEAVEYATRAYTGHEMNDRRSKEVSLAEQVELLQAQIAELTVNSLQPPPLPPT